MHKSTNAHKWKAKNLTWKQTIRTLKALWGCLWNQRLAHRFKKARTLPCVVAWTLLATSLIGGCDHPSARVMKISRHDGEMIQQAISKGSSFPPPQLPLQGLLHSVPASFISLLTQTFDTTMSQAEATTFKLNSYAVICVDKMFTHRHHVGSIPSQNPG